MKAKIKVEKEVDIKYLQVKAEVRYWEDANINGECSEEGDFIPFKEGDMWCPKIDIDLGIVVDWPKGTIAEIHFKVCDCGSYYLQDEKCETILSIEDYYVPTIMCPKEEGYGDYIIMDIDENGQIQDWKVDIRAFYDSQE